MKIHGAYMTVGQFLHTCKEGIVYTGKDTNSKDSWHLKAGRIIIIPDYQREYRWEEKQLSELVGDINNGNCYLGQIAVSINSNEPYNYYLVDGQQRITSIIILLTVLCRQFYIQNDTINIKKFELHDAQNNEVHENGGNPKISRLRFEANCFPEFQKFIAQIYNLHVDSDGNFNPNDFDPPSFDDYRQMNRYISACSSLNRIIANNLDRFF